MGDIASQKNNYRNPFLYQLLSYDSCMCIPKSALTSEKQIKYCMPFFRI
jgi:hypothetical protein